MTLKEANYLVEKLDNEINLLLRDKELLESKVGIQSIDTSKVTVQGGKRVDRFLEYVSSKEVKKIDEELKVDFYKYTISNMVDKEDNQVLSEYFEEFFILYDQPNIQLS